MLQLSIEMLGLQPAQCFFVMHYRRRADWERDVVLDRMGRPGACYHPFIRAQLVSLQVIMLQRAPMSCMRLLLLASRLLLCLLKGTQISHGVAHICSKEYAKEHWDQFDSCAQAMRLMSSARSIVLYMSAPAEARRIGCWPLQMSVFATSDLTSFVRTQTCAYDLECVGLSPDESFAVPSRAAPSGRPAQMHSAMLVSPASSPPRRNNMH